MCRLVEGGLAVGGTTGRGDARDEVAGGAGVLGVLAVLGADAVDAQRVPSVVATGSAAVRVVPSLAGRTKR
jgi:hypothetical protein